MKTRKACRNTCVLGANVITHSIYETRSKPMTITVRTKLGEVEKEGGIITLEETNSKPGGEIRVKPSEGVDVIQREGRDVN